MRLAAESGRPLTHIARELTIQTEQLRRSRRQLGGTKPTTSGGTLRRLRRELKLTRQERDFIRGSGGVLRERVPVRYACIAQHRAEYLVRLMCRVLAVSRAWFYAWVDRAPSRRAQTDARLRVAIRASHAESRRSYGSPRIHRELRAQGQRHGRKRIARLMRGEGLRAKRSRRYRVTTQSNATRPAAPNTLGRQLAVRGVNRVWVGDVTACWTGEGWLYLAALLDLGPRRVVGWATSGTLDQALTQAALRRALV